MMMNSQFAGDISGESPINKKESRWDAFIRQKAWM